MFYMDNAGRLSPHLEQRGERVLLSTGESLPLSPSLSGPNVFWYMFELEARPVRWHNAE